MSSIFSELYNPEDVSQMTEPNATYELTPQAVDANGNPLTTEATVGPQYPPPGVEVRPVEVRFVKESFEGVDPNVVKTVKQAYMAGNATLGSAGLDLRYVGTKPLLLGPGETQIVHTGLAIHLRDPNMVGLITPRSGRGSEGLVLGNLTGVIDSDYQGELLVNLWNRNLPKSGLIWVIEPGERIAQYFVVQRYHLQFQLVEAFGETTARGTGGFGHTGRF